MNTVLIIPTGIGAEIGGHAGDGNVVATLLGSVSKILITHPNVVNASDINEMPSNALYVEGSTLDRFLNKEIELNPVHANKILVVVNSPVTVETIDAVSAARCTLGIQAEILELNTPLEMIATMENGKATGIVNGWKELVSQVNKYHFDALAITSRITVDKKVALDYFKKGGVNPWGGVEAKASRLIATALNKPVAHAPMDTSEDSVLKQYKELVDPRLSAEMISVCYFHCVLKGLHKAPRIGKGLSVNEVDIMVSPYGCWGRPHEACIKNNIPIIVVKENKTIEHKPVDKSCIFVDNYLEAAGVIKAMEQGISLDTLRRPIAHTKIIKRKEDE